MATKITDHYFQYGTLKYFRGNAHLLEMCTFGEKKDPAGPKAYVDPEGRVKRKYVDHRLKTGGTVGINWNETTQADAEVNGKIKVFGVGVKFATAFNYSRVKSANVRLYNLFINERPLKKMLNNDAKIARNYLRDEGNDGRIVSEIWVALEAELSDHFDTSASISISESGADLDITASGGKHGSQTISISSGTTFAYKLHKVKKWNSGKTKIEDMEADYKGDG